MCIPRISLGNARRLVTILCDDYNISYVENDYKCFLKLFYILFFAFEIGAFI